MRATQLPYLLLLAGLVSACSDSDDNDIVSWMAEQRNTIKPSVTAVAEPKNLILPPTKGPKKRNRSAFPAWGGLKSDPMQNDAGSALLLPGLNRRKRHSKPSRLT